MPHQSKGQKQRRCVGPESQRWAALEEILEEMAFDDDVTRKHLATISRKLDRILALLQAPGDTGAALTELANDVDDVRTGLKQSVDDNTPAG